MSLYNMLIGQDDYIDRNVSRARNQYDAGIGNTIRTAGRMGINPNSGAFLNMLNNAQYERTAGLNAVGNDASYNYLNMAQNQFNKDRDFAFNQKKFDAAQNIYWTNRMDALNNLDFQRDSELAALREKNNILQERMNSMNEQTPQKQADEQKGQTGNPSSPPGGMDRNTVRANMRSGWSTSKAYNRRRNVYSRMFGRSPFTRGASMMDAFADNYYGR